MTRIPRRAWPFVVLAAAFVVLVPRRQFLTGDPTWYVGLARSLAAGAGYTFDGETITVYPPGLSALLAPFVAWFDPDPLVAQLVVAALAAPAVLAAVCLAVRSDRRLAIPMGAIIAANAAFFSLATTDVRSDLPFFVVTIAALVLLLGAKRDAGVGRAVAVGGLVVAAVMFRTAGIALVAALILTFGHRRVAKQPPEGIDQALLLGGVVGLGAALLWVGWSMLLGGDSYLQHLVLVDPLEPDLGLVTPGQLVVRLAGNLRAHLIGLAQLATNLPWLAPSWTSPLLVVVLLLLAAGARVELAKPNPLLGWYLLSYSGLVLVWPFREGTRFLIPLLPVAVLLGYQGGEALIRRLRGSGPKRYPALAMGAVALALLAAIEAATTSSRQVALHAVGWSALAAVLASASNRSRVGAWLLLNGRRLGAGYLTVFVALGLVRIGTGGWDNINGVDPSPNQRLEPAVDWLAKHAAKDDVVMAQLASAVHFYTGRRTATFPRTRQSGPLTEAIQGPPVRYLVILDPPRFEYWRPSDLERFAVLDQALPGRFTVSYRYAGGTVYRFD